MNYGLSTPLVTLDIILERYILDARAFIISKVFENGKYICTVANDLLGSRAEVFYIPILYELNEGEKLAFIPELILCHQEFKKFNQFLLEKNATRLKIQVIENWQYRHGEQLIAKEKQTVFSKFKQFFSKIWQFISKS